MAVPTEKRCPMCGETKPASDWKIKGGKRGERLDSYCIPCTRLYQNEHKKKKYAERDPEVNRFRLIQRNYGMARDQYIDMMLEQDFCCGICGDPVEASRWVVDHDHQTGKVRGLLHQGCNSGLGKLGDNIEGLRKAIAYLEAHHAKS